MNITVIDYNRQEWHRMARHCEAKDRHDVAQLFEAAAAHNRLPILLFDELQSNWRNWLVFDQLPSEGVTADLDRALFKLEP